MKFFPFLLRTPATVKLEIEPNFLASLLASGHIHITDFRCLDLNSKQIVWKMLLLLAKSKLAAAKHDSKTVNTLSESPYPSPLPGEFDHV
ncbi:hypothetical protein [Candidatus Methylomicrobium oryzae]|uniref:hypothetical protein n=1 Tax=Candidatus Methylomicrobium oryzae TaxID=2802053 RepID=UPI0019217AEF|nr:hypothetical protein [Methylomicrobium sp. RS1]MBL1265178.1 hypothetical protein [Methylomicrobium sp. RS1]